MPKRFFRFLFIMAPLGVLLGASFVMVRNYEQKIYASEAVIELHSIVDVLEKPQSFSADFEKINNSSFLGKVVKNLDLTNRWAVDENKAIEILKANVTITNTQGTNFVRIHAQHTNKADTKLMVDGILAEYKEFRTNFERQQAEKVLEEVRAEIAKQEAKIAEKTKILGEFTRQAKTPRDFDSQNYVNAVRGLESEKSRLQPMKLKLIGTQTMAGMIDGFFVREKPEIPNFPVCQDLTQELVLGSGIGMFCFPLITLVSMRAIRWGTRGM